MTDRLSRWKFYYLPTLFNYYSEDTALKGATIVGMIFSLLAFLGIVPALFLALTWILYLSFVTVGAPFLRFQWDSLILEIGFAAFFVALMTPPPTLLIIGLWILLFRFMFTSGLVKWMSRCPEWRSLKAMKIHFESQPLPNIGGYFAHNLLGPFTKLTTLGVYFFEWLVPFLYLGTPEMRLIGALLSLFFQGLIIVTGNYAFFNLLTIALIIPLIDNIYLGWCPTIFYTFQSFDAHLWLSLPLNVLGAVMIFINAIMLLTQVMGIGFMHKFITILSHFEITNFYGLFAVMTTERDEIIFEGSDDGIEWREYVFKYKPQSLNQAPKQIAPLQPRLDWQMWFVSLNPYYQGDRWLYVLIQRLLENSPEVVKLFAYNPFKDAPPKFIRAQFYRYHFSSLKEWWSQGIYWTRTYRGIFLTPYSLKKE